MNNGLNRPVTTSKLSELTDSQLYNQCKEVGANIRLFTRRFAGLLCEAYGRKLYKRRGYASIYEFAAKMAGMNESMVDRILNLSEKLNDKPVLKGLFEAGAVGWSKLEKVSYVATPQTDNEWAEKAKKLDTRALEEYVKEYRKSAGSNFRLGSTHVGDGENNQPLWGGVGGEPEAKWNTLRFPISLKVEQKLRLLRQKFEKEKSTTMTWNEVISEMIRRLDAKEEKSVRVKKIVQLCPDCIKRRADEAERANGVTRYIPTEVRDVVDARSEKRCEFPGCKRSGESYHHTRRYALKKNHDPDFIVSVCTAHERLAHAGLIENEEQSPVLWKIRDAPNEDELKFFIDERVAEFRLMRESRSLSVSS